MKLFDNARRFLQRAERWVGLVEKARLPVPFYRVLQEELKLLRPDPARHSAELSATSNWFITEQDVTDWDGLSARWDLLQLDKLVQEVRGVGAHRFRGYVQDLARSCSQSARTIAKAALVRIRKTPASKEPAASPLAVGAEPRSREGHLKDMEDLVRAKKCLGRYETFPSAHLSKSMSKLVNSFFEEDAHDQVEELNRLILDDLFAEQVQRAYSRRLQAVRQSMRAANLSALCLSGGGIRSATFCLGILQGLARKGVLQEFDFLSTVSGGGYIGSWLSAWLHHQGPKAAQVFEELNLKDPNTRFPVEPMEIVHLRQYSNYLAPRLGFLSGDTWVLIGTYLRNLLLNWMVFGPFLLAACAVPRLCVAILRTSPSPFLMNSFLVSGILLATLALAYVSAAHPGAEGMDPNGKQKDVSPSPNQAGELRPYKRQAKEFIRLHGPRSFFWFCLIPVYASAALLTTFWLWFYTPGNSKGFLFPPQQSAPNPLNYVGFALLVTLVGWLLAQIWLILRTKAFVVPYPPGVELGTGIVAGLLFYTVAHFGLPLIQNGITSREVLLPFAAFAAPLVLLVFLIAGTVFVGFSCRWSTDEDREWWARMGAWILVVAVAWAALCAWILLGALLFFKASAFVSSIGGLSGLVTLILAHSGLTSAKVKTPQQTDRVSVLAKYSLALAAPIFLASVVAGLSMFGGWLMYRLASTPLSQNGFYRGLIGGTRFGAVQPWSQQGYLAIIEGTHRHLAINFILFMLVLGGAVSLLVNINRFSLHAVYRNRLVRAYLGASNPKRKPNLFTGFDPEDNFGLGGLRQNADACQRPLHIINMALNLVGGKELAWQQRKAETFTASKLFVGNFRLGFRPTREYASSQQPGGLTLGTAMAISGAAANPNMGYHSSPVVAFLMTLFNIRLGCWLGNPGPAGQRTYQVSAPPMPIWYAAKEAFGLSDDTTGFVCLSDGGHFENLGLYEMIQRRCQTIVVCDAGCDPSCSLEDLGNAIRKIRADLGVRIDIQNFNIYSRDDKRYEDLDLAEIGRYCALGDIYYEPDSEAPSGTLIYIKPAICGKEPKDVFNYKQANPTFPHESTADQFFSESQFESYRALGVWVIQRIYGDRPAPAKKEPGRGPLEDFTRMTSDYAQANGGKSIADGGDGKDGVERAPLH